MAMAEAAFSFATRLVAIVEPIEEHAVCQAGQQSRQDQRFIARGLPGQHITRRKQDHQRQQQLFTRHTPGQRRQYRGADRHAQRVDRDQQSRRRQEIESC